MENSFMLSAPRPLSNLLSTIHLIQLRMVIMLLCILGENWENYMNEINLVLTYVIIYL